MRTLLLLPGQGKEIPQLETNQFYKAVVDGRPPPAKRTSFQFKSDVPAENKAIMGPPPKRRRRVARPAALENDSGDSDDDNDSPSSANSSSHDSSGSNSSSSNSSHQPLAPPLPPPGPEPDAGDASDREGSGTDDGDGAPPLRPGPRAEDTLSWKSGIFRFNARGPRLNRIGWEVHCRIPNHTTDDRRCTRSLIFSRARGREACEHML